jgi:hypothetical protein
VELILFALFSAFQGAVCALILRRVDGYEPAACDGCGGPLEVQADAPTAAPSKAGHLDRHHRRAVGSPQPGRGQGSPRESLRPRPGA